MIETATTARAGVILVVEDEPGIVDFLKRGLGSYGYEVLTALDGLTGTDQALTQSVDLVVLDLMLPGRSGLDVLATIRQTKPSLPVIALTARSDLDDRVAGLDAGLVDYLVKPFSLRELAARIRAQLRAASEAPSTTIAAGDVEMDLITRQVRRREELVRLSSTEFELLSYLMRNRNRVLTREQILRAVWGYDYDPGTNVVDVYIGYLRRKLRRPDSPAPIVTVRTVGYRFDAEAAR
ncbi:MAG TPA: response regulator transcription factor [Solirubrobacteraceae bacterium]|nr:response regulator transcription factor [Solirubrobacteraceae bacterium]